MPMKVQPASAPTKITGRWLQDPTDRSILLPNGITVDDTQFTANAQGRKIIASGTLLGRKANELLFGPAADDDTELYFAWKDYDLAIDGTLIEAVRRGAIFEGLLPAAVSNTNKSKLVNRGFQFIPYTGDGIDE